MELSKRDIPVVTGPTAAGKTALSLLLAEKIGGEIINMDSRQIFRKMDIGTAKPTADERACAPHHLIDIVDPGDRYTAGDFVEDCNSAIEDIFSRGRIPIIVGGTPFYLSALLGEFDFCNVDSDMEYRGELRKRVEVEGKESVHEELRRLDPVSAESIHPNDVYRVIRALEICRVSGKPASELRKRESVYPEKSHTEKNDFHIYALYMEREKLYDLINLRAARMFASGLIEETEELYAIGGGVREFLKKTIGYAQAIDVITGEADVGAAVEETSKQTRRFAKRQMTWFRSIGEITWLDRDSMPEADMAETVAAGIKILT